MAKQKTDLTGQRFGRYTVIKEAITHDKNRKWECRCDCGTIKEVFQNALVIGRVKSCGCFNKDQKTKHGLEKHPLYPTWRNMVNRCTNPNDARWHQYGGRGITVCARWIGSPSNFIEDMGDRPNGASLDRINNDGDYSPENCRWADGAQQHMNRSVTIWVGDKCLTHAAREKGISLSTVYARIHRSGWTIEEALNTPVGKKR